MPDPTAPSQKRDRSPQFPYIGLGKALERIEKLFEKAKRHEARVADVAADWGLTAKSSSTDRNVAALLAYGLVEDSGTRETRKIKISEIGWRILDDKRPGVRGKLLAEAALKPPIIAEYARLWADGRPDDTHALSQLKFEGGFTDEGAAQFLRVFDETIRFTKGVEPARTTDTGEVTAREYDGENGDNPTPSSGDRTPPPPPPPVGKMKEPMAGERELTAGLLSKGANFRLIVSGRVGVKEIERLIQKLAIDKEILADPDDASEIDWGEPE